jgi:hypothetical protein
MKIRLKIKKQRIIRRKIPEIEKIKLISVPKKEKGIPIKKNVFHLVVVAKE